MELKEIVASYADKTGKEIDLKNLSKDNSFRNMALDAILKAIKGKPWACVLFPSYQESNDNLGHLINEVAASLQIRTLVTGGVENLRRLRNANKKEVILVKQSFRTGGELAEQIASIKKMGSNVSVLCLISHSRERLKSFAKENNVEISALVYADEI